MSQVGRENNNNIAEARDEDRPRLGGSNLAVRSNKPLFTSRRATRRRSADNEDGSSSSPAKTALSSGNWLTGRSARGIKLGEAFHRIDNNGKFELKSATGVGAVGGNKNSSPSRIPRSKIFAGSSAESLAKGDGSRISRLPEEVVASESDSTTDTRDGSPSPAARNRRRWSEESGFGVVGIAEDATEDDDLDRKMTNFAKDQRRINNVLSSKTGLFSRADIGPRIAETTRTLARKTSASSLESEPPLRPPKTWGSRAKSRSDWMKRILSPDATLELKEAAILSQDAPAADVPLPSVENGSSALEPTPPASRPASAHQNMGSPEKGKMWDADIDFTAHSLQVSTSPQLRVRSTKLDEVRQRELESLTARAVASSMLDDIKERNSEERSALESTSMIAETSRPALRSNANDEAQGEIHEKTILEEEGEVIQGTPITVFSAGNYRSTSNNSSREHVSDQKRKGSPGSLDHKQEDSREILRRLSRATSSSPAPSRSQGKSPSPERRSSGDRSKGTETSKRDILKGKSLDVDVENKRRSTTSTPPKSDVDPEERITAEAKLFELQDNRSEKNSLRALSRSPSPDVPENFDETPRPKADPLLFPTPRVTGAYIETPAPTIRKPWTSRSVSDSYELVVEEDGDISILERQRPSDNVVETSNSVIKGSKERTRSRSTSSRRRNRNASELPASTSVPLQNSTQPSTASEDLRLIQMEAQIEDSTLDDFDALLEADRFTTADFIANNTISKPMIDLEYDEKGNILSQAERERRMERLTLDRMNQHLKNTSSSIRDARQGIERLEHQVLSSSPSPNSKSKNDDNTFYIRIPVPRLWTANAALTDSQPKSSSRRTSPFPWSRSWKFTWLGLILTLFFSWYVAESTMCEIYCHPTYASTNNWHYTDPFFPWAIPTKLDQWTGNVASSLVGPVWDDFWDGFEDWLEIDHRDRYRNRRMRIRRPVSPGTASNWWSGSHRPANTVQPRQRESVSGSDGSGRFADDEIVG